MKKTLAAVAVLGAFAGSALAADVTLYGKVDGGINYQRLDVEVDTPVVKMSGDQDSFGFRSGQNSGSRWGLKGSEQISEGLTVGFQLENGFTVDDGKLGQGSRLFGREARVYAKTDFGTFHFGRMGGLDSGLGSVDVFGGKASAFGTGWGDTVGSNTDIFLGMSGRMDNTLTYESPAFAGMKVYAQVSLDPNSEGNNVVVGNGEGSHDVNRYYALGLSANYDALDLGLVVSTTDYKRDFANEPGGADNSKVVSAFGSYDFGVAKVMLGAQYFDDVEYGSEILTLSTGASTLVKGYGVMLGATVPVSSGTLYASVGYNDIEQVEDSALNGNVMNFAVGYKYPLSKRTYLYTAAGYSQFSGEESDFHIDADVKVTEVMAGMVHNF